MLRSKPVSIISGVDEIGTILITFLVTITKITGTRVQTMIRIFYTLPRLHIDNSLSVTNACELNTLGRYFPMPSYRYRLFSIDTYVDSDRREIDSRYGYVSNRS